MSFPQFIKNGKVRFSRCVVVEDIPSVDVLFMYFGLPHRSDGLSGGLAGLMSTGSSGSWLGGFGLLGSGG
jgi:hypothetical protein